MKNPFQDDDGSFAPLPERVVALLIEADATARLVAHLRLVHDVALRLLDGLSRAWPDLRVDSEAVLFGAATHDIGKAVQPNELYEPGAMHEVIGRRMLIDSGVEERLARFAETHAKWKTSDDCTLEDLLVALADTCWKGKRSERLDGLVCEKILGQIGGERWEVFATLDALIDDLAMGGDQRLAWQSRYGSSLVSR